MDQNEQQAAAAFTKQSGVFDALFSANTIIRYKRQRVRDRAVQDLAPGSRILELNCGTGEDASWFAETGHFVHATDLSPGMLTVLEKKIIARGLQNRVSTECCSFTRLDALQNKGPYDLIFSNFGGLNCTGMLPRVLDAFDGLLRPGGRVVLVVMPGFCLWETMLLFKGKFRTAFRRIGSNGTKAKVEGKPLTCWYYNPLRIVRRLGSGFQLLGLEGLCSLVPPAYMEGFPEKHPRLYRFLKKKEDRLKARWPWNRIGDYFILSLRKKTIPPENRLPD